MLGDDQTPLTFNGIQQSEQKLTDQEKTVRAGCQRYKEAIQWAKQGQDGSVAGGVDVMATPYPTPGILASESKS